MFKVGDLVTHKDTHHEAVFEVGAVNEEHKTFRIVIQQHGTSVLLNRWYQAEYYTLVKPYAPPPSYEGEDWI